MLDRRKTVRTRSFFGGKIEFNHQNSLMDCVVRNISSDGAKLVFTNTAAVPREFTLSIPKQDQSFRARMVWQNTNEAGVAFSTRQAHDAPSPPVPLDCFRRLKTCEAEKAALQRRVEELTAFAE
jgi:hypothetical protein